jgi:hypothetical protein
MDTSAFSILQQYNAAAASASSAETLTTKKCSFKFTFF